MFDHLKHQSAEKPKRYSTFSYSPRYYNRDKEDFEFRRKEIEKKIKEGKADEIGQIKGKKAGMGRRTKIYSLIALGFIMVYVWFALGFTLVSTGICAAAAYAFVKLSNR